VPLAWGYDLVDPANRRRRRLTRLPP